MPGRLERFSTAGCLVLLDAAHNPAGARALAAYVRATEPSGVTLVFGAMADKAVAEMLAALAPIAQVVICTTAPNPRAALAPSGAAARPGAAAPAGAAGLPPAHGAATQTGPGSPVVPQRPQPGSAPGALG